MKDRYARGPRLQVCTWEQALHVEWLAERCAGALKNDCSREALGVIEIRQHRQSAQHLQVVISEDTSTQRGLTLGSEGSRGSHKGSGAEAGWMCHIQQIHTFTRLRA